MASPKKTVTVPKVDFEKKWTNGHKSMNSAQTEALRELLMTEQHTCVDYSKNCLKMIKPRNPLVGEKTPRDVNGAPVLNLRAYNAVVSHGTPLFPAGITEPTFVKVPKEPVGKIGVNERALDILGNKGVNKSVSQPEDLFLKTQNELARKTARLQEEEALKECKRKAHEKRQINILSREVERLRGEAIEKEKEILTLRQKYPS